MGTQSKVRSIGDMKTVSFMPLIFCSFEVDLLGIGNIMAKVSYKLMVDVTKRQNGPASGLAQFL